MARISFAPSITTSGAYPPGSQRLVRQVGAAIVEITHGGATYVAVDELRDLAVLVHGDVYEPFGSNPAELILERYGLDQAAVWRHLNGSMAVLVMDGRHRKVMAVTDRVNSRKIFMSEDHAGWWLSSSLNIHPTEGFSIDPAGVGSLLTNSVMHNNLTPFREVKTLPRASIHMFTPAGCASNEYWRYDFTGENRHVPRIEVRNQLRELLRESVRRRVRTIDGRIFISMSGGNDSKSIAGFLTEAVGPERLSAFTYHHGPRIGDVDAPAAELAARFLGVEHQTVELFDGDLMRVVATNATQGQGMKLCKETDFWHRVGPRMGGDSSNALFVGDTPWGMKRRRTEGGKEDVLALVQVYPPSGIEWFLARLPSDQAQSIRDGWQANFEELRGRVPGYEDHRDAQSFMYLDQRIANFLTLWRECFQMPYVRVFNPYLDNDVLDFARTVSGDLREDKSIYKEAVISAFPDLMRFPASHGGFGLPSFANEIIAQHQDARNLLQSRPSRLDELVPPEAIDGLIDSRTASIAVGFDRLRDLGKQVPKRMVATRRLVRSFKTRVRAASSHRVPWPELVLHLLAIRSFLAKDSDPPTPGLPANSAVD